VYHTQLMLPANPSELNESFSVDIMLLSYYFIDQWFWKYRENRDILYNAEDWMSFEVGVTPFRNRWTEIGSLFLLEMFRKNLGHGPVKIFRKKSPSELFTLVVKYLDPAAIIRMNCFSWTIHTAPQKGIDQKFFRWIFPSQIPYPQKLYIRFPISLFWHCRESNLYYCMGYELTLWVYETDMNTSMLCYPNLTILSFRQYISLNYPS